jgi:cytochrome c oxidase subunit II
VSPGTSPSARLRSAGAPLRTLLVAGLLGLSGCNFNNLWAPDENPFTTIHPVTDFGTATQNLYAMITWWTIVIAVVVFAILGYILVRFRDDGKPTNPKQVHGNQQLELGWTMVPVVIVVAISVPTIRTIFEIGDAAPKDALEIRVVGKRWWWEFDYVKDGLVTGNELHVPANTPLSFLIESTSVIHSFWTPRLGGKRDAVPGRINRMWYTIQEIPEAGKPIEYLGECAEYCGEQHARMRFRIYSHHDQQEFNDWMTKMKTPVVIPESNALAKKGEAMFTTAGCAGCHSIIGNPQAVGTQGPSLTHYADRHSIGAGAVLLDNLSDDEKAKLLHQWIRDPDSLKSGTTKMHNPSRELDGMNIPKTDLTDEEIDSLVAYLMAQK